MKKIIVLIVCLIFANCEIKPREAKAQGFWMLSDCQIGYREINGMKYAIFVPGNSDVYTGAAVVNLTKDELEVEMLKLQIAKLKKE